MSSDSAKPRPKRRWWIRLLRGALLLLLLLVLLLSGSLWWAYSKRVSLLNNALANVGPVQGTVGSFEVTPTGGIEMHDLVFTDRATGAVMARVPQVSGQANLSKLPPEEIRSLTLRDPEITITEAMLENWRKAAADSPNARGNAPPIPFGIRFNKVDLQNAHVRFEQKDGTVVELKVNYRGDDLNVQPGGLATGDQELTIEEGSVKSKSSGDAPLALQKLHAKGRVQDGIVHLEDISLDQPALHLTPELLTMFGLNFAATPTGSPRDAKAPTTTTKAAPSIPSSGLVRGIQIKNVAVRDATLSAEGFTKGNLSGLNLPDTRVKATYEAQGIEWREGAALTIATQKMELHDLSLEAPDDGGHLQLKATYEAHGTEWREGAAPNIASQKMELRDVSLEAPNNSGHVRLGSASFDFSTADNGAQWVIESLMLTTPDIHWTPQLRTLLTSQGPAPKGDAAANAPSALSPAPPVPAPARPTVQLKQATVSDALVDIADPALVPFEIHTRGALRLADLLLNGKGLHSQSFQTIEVTESSLVFPASKDGAARKPWLELPHGEMTVKPDDWNEHTRIAKLALEKIVVRMRDGNTPWDSSQSPVQGSQSNSTTPAPPQTENREPRTENPPWWKRINCGQLTVNEGRVDLVLDAPKPVDMQAQVNITTQRMDNGGSQHTVRVANLTARLPTLSPTPFPVAQADLIEGVVRLPEMWTQKRFDELHLTGASVDLSEALLKLFEPDKPAEAAATTPPSSKPDEPEAANPKPEPSGARQTAEGSPKGEDGGPNQTRNPKPDSPWQVGLLSVNNSSVTVTNLVPGLPAVKFGVSLEVKDTPLLAEDIAQSVASQRIELHDLKIPSPNGTARYVAELDSIFVTFTLGGLMRKEIDGIEIVSPTLFVGEDLFWYVDFYRKYAERGAQPSPKAREVAANDAQLDLALANAVTEAEPPTSQASWSVKRLQVHSGKLVLAPKGVPLEGFHTPFPFHIDSEVTRGTLNADMEIPADTYELPEVNLQFVGMTGRVQFNLPLKQKDNNLVETFEVDSIRWKGIRTGKAFLSVTYDSAGIYSKFGADAYEGYLNGEFNVYTDDSFHWDGWVGGKNVQTHDLTRILCPGYFIMDGRVEATLVAQGSKDELYQADGSFKNHTPGTFTIKALNGLIKDLPKSLEPLNAQIAKIGLETLRDFKYERAEMKCRFYGREGNGTLQFSGPNGSRNFDINVYDHRWRTEDPTKVITSSGTVKDQKTNDRQMTNDE